MTGLPAGTGGSVQPAGRRGVLARRETSVRWRCLRAACAVGDAAMVGGGQTAAAMAGGNRASCVALGVGDGGRASAVRLPLGHLKNRTLRRNAGRRGRVKRAGLKSSRKRCGRPADSNRQTPTRRLATTPRLCFPLIVSHVCFRQPLRRKHGRC